MTSLAARKSLVPDAATNPCAVCHGTVYLMERLDIDGKRYHKKCGLMDVPSVSVVQVLPLQRVQKDAVGQHICVGAQQAVLQAAHEGAVPPHGRARDLAPRR